MCAAHRRRQVLAWLEGALCRATPALCLNILSMLCGYDIQNLNATRLPVYLSYTPAGSSVANMAHWSQARGWRSVGRAACAGRLRLAATAAAAAAALGAACTVARSRACHRRRRRPLAQKPKTGRQMYRWRGVGPTQLLRRYDFGSDCGAPSEPRPPASPRCNPQAYNGSSDPPTYNLSALGQPPAARLWLFAGGADRLATPADTELLLEALPPGAVAGFKNLPTYEHLDFIWASDAAEALYPPVLDILRRSAADGG
jgi:hypothetical protein